VEAQGAQRVADAVIPFAARDPDAQPRRLPRVDGEAGRPQLCGQIAAGAHGRVGIPVEDGQALGRSAVHGFTAI
jgi:hypothetical protein